MPHFECGAFNHSATSPEGAMEGAGPLWLGALIGEDGGPDKAGRAKIRCLFRPGPPRPGTNARERRFDCRFDAFLSGAWWSPIREPQCGDTLSPTLPRERGRGRTAFGAGTEIHRMFEKTGWDRPTR